MEGCFSEKPGVLRDINLRGVLIAEIEHTRAGVTFLLGVYMPDKQNLNVEEGPAKFGHVEGLAMWKVLQNLNVGGLL